MTLRETAAEMPDIRCSYGASPLVCRGPRRCPEGRYTVALGGSVTFGRFVERPWPELLEEATGRMVVNLAAAMAGPDAYLADPEIPGIAAQAVLGILELPAAANLCNRYYRVHPRRGDRFIALTEAGGRLFPEIDTADVHFTGQLLRTLSQAGGAERFARVEAALRAAWQARMAALIRSLGCPVLLLRLPGGPVGAGPAIEGWMLDGLAPLIEGVVTPPGGPGPGTGNAGMVFPPEETAAATALPGPALHAEIAGALAAALEDAAM